MVLLRREETTRTLVSPATFQLGERILETYSATTRRLRRMIDQFWFPPFARAIQRLTIPGIFIHYALRKKCIANRARAALSRGTGQLVVLGAGFDGCALELSREHPQARFWEVDHPATQQWKSRVLGEIEREHFHLIPADLREGVLPSEALAASGFDPGAASFWIAEGLLMYFPAATVQALLESITGQTSEGSEIAFSFMEKRADGRIRFEKQSGLVDWWLARRGEPFLWAGSRVEVRTLLRSWQEVTFYDENDLRLLGDLNRSLHLAAGEVICSAIR